MDTMQHIHSLGQFSARQLLQVVNEPGVEQVHHAQGGNSPGRTMEWGNGEIIGVEKGEPGVCYCEGEDASDEERAVVDDKEGGIHENSQEICKIEGWSSSCKSILVKLSTIQVSLLH